MAGKYQPIELNHLALGECILESVKHFNGFASRCTEILVHLFSANNPPNFKIMTMDSRHYSCILH